MLTLRWMSISIFSGTPSLVTSIIAMSSPYAAFPWFLDLVSPGGAASPPFATAPAEGGPDSEAPEGSLAAGGDDPEGCVVAAPVGGACCEMAETGRFAPTLGCVWASFSMVLETTEPNEFFSSLDVFPQPLNPLWVGSCERQRRKTAAQLLRSVLKKGCRNVGTPSFR